ncbi:MAG: ATP-binding cassette domain-containing protein, partial [Gemmatimonadota bacterium]|nr:ATP-binding cassette domain-containing protein [Gemmatimonadota bacterium]
MIALRNLTAQVGTFELRDISFAIPTGQYGVVIGPAGSGKTTLLEAVAGVSPVRSGVVMLDEVDATRLPPERRSIGFVYQHGYLFPHLSVEQNVAYGAASADTAREAAARIGVEHLNGRMVRSLSG